MKDLVEVKYNKVFATSNVIGTEFGVAHKEILRKIDNLRVEISTLEFNQMYVKNVYVNPKGREYDNYHLTRKGYMFLVMNISSKKAHKKKLAFIDAFDLMENTLRNVLDNKSDVEWNESVIIGKQARLEETDTIKELVEYATKQGSKNAKFYYKHITNATYKALGLMAQKHPKLRAQMNIYEISQLMLAEKFASNKIREYMALERNYKDIYNSVKDDLINFSNAVRFN